MKILKKMSYAIGIVVTILFTISSFSHGLGSQGNATQEDFPYGNQYKATAEGNVENTNLGKIIKTDSVTTTDNSLLYKIRKLFRVTGTEVYDSEKPAREYIKMIMNMALGLVSFVSLVLIIYSFYLIFFQKGEEAFGKAKKVLTGVAIAIVFIGISWVIVDMFYEIYEKEAIKGLDSKTGIFN